MAALDLTPSQLKVEIPYMIHVTDVMLLLKQKVTL